VDQWSCQSSNSPKLELVVSSSARRSSRVTHSPTHESSLLIARSEEFALSFEVQNRALRTTVVLVPQEKTDTSFLQKMVSSHVRRPRAPVPLRRVFLDEYAAHALAFGPRNARARAALSAAAHLRFRPSTARPKSLTGRDLKSLSSSPGSWRQKQLFCASHFWSSGNWNPG